MILERVVIKNFTKDVKRINNFVRVSIIGGIHISYEIKVCKDCNGAVERANGKYFCTACNRMYTQEEFDNLKIGMVEGI